MGGVLMKKLIKCKTCGAEIAKKAKTCPRCGAKQHQGAYIAISIIVVFVIIVAIGIAVGNNDSNLTSNQKGASNSNTTISENSIGLDDTLHADCFDIKIKNVKWTNALKTSIGTVTPENEEESLLCIIFSAKNMKDTTRNVANIGFNAYVDGKKVLPKVVVGSIDDAMVFVGAVSPGMEIVGFSVWELPKDWKEFQTSYIDAGTGIESKQHFLIHREDVH